MHAGNIVGCRICEFVFWDNCWLAGLEGEWGKEYYKVINRENNCFLECVEFPASFYLLRFRSGMELFWHTEVK